MSSFIIRWLSGSAHLVLLLANNFQLTEEERSDLLPSGKQTTFANRVHWAKSYLGKADLVELTKRAHLRITDRGRNVLANPPQRIDIHFLEQFPEFVLFREAGSGTDKPADGPAEVEVALLRSFSSALSFSCATTDRRRPAPVRTLGTGGGYSVTVGNGQSCCARLTRAVYSIAEAKYRSAHENGG